METNLTIKELTNKMNAFVQSKGWYNAETKRPQTAKNLSISLSLEAGEILEHFQWSETARDKEDLEGEQ